MIGIAPLRSRTSSWSGAGIMSATKLKQMIPSYGESLIDDAALCRRLRADTAAVLRPQNIRARRSRGARWSTEADVCGGRARTRTGTPKSGMQILSLLCLPFHHAA
jgi:hypothetical protein